MGTSLTTELNVEASLPSAVWGQFVAPFLAGDEPFVEQASFDEVAVDDLLGDGVVRCRVAGDGRNWVLVEVGSCTVVLQGFGGGVFAAVRGSCRDDVEKAMVDLRSRAPQRVVDDSIAAFDFRQVDNGAYTSTRRIACPDWPDVASNYPSEVRTEVLMRDDATSEQWRVLVVEDADELLREDAKDRVGQALSRLLNVGDGLLGQGLKVQVLITTNEPVKRLHPALIRPGRCLSEIDFRRFTRSEATAAFGDELPAGDQLTLAEILNPNAAPDLIDLTGTGLYL